MLIFTLRIVLYHSTNLVAGFIKALEVVLKRRFCVWFVRVSSGGTG